MVSKINTYVKKSIRFSSIAIISTLLVAVICYAAQIYPDIIVKGAPWYDIRGYASLSAALTAIDTSEKTLLVLGNVAVSADTIIPTTTHVWYLGSGKFTIASGKVLTHNGSITAANHLIWVGPGTIVPPKVPLNLAWMGSLANAVALLTTSTCEVEITNSYTQAANVTTPSTMTISFKVPGSVSVSNTYTWTIQGPIYGRAGCFQGNGKVVPSALQMNASEWWLSFEKVVADIGTNVRGLSISVPSVISGNLTVPATIKLEILASGSLNPAGGTTTTLNCPLIANYAIAFGGSGTVIYARDYIRVYTEAELIANKDYTKEVIISAAITLTAGLTTTAPIYISPSCPITLGNYNLLENGIHLSNGRYAQYIFNGTGIVSGLADVYPEWCGAIAGTSKSTGIRGANTTAINNSWIILKATGKGVLHISDLFEVNNSIDLTLTALGSFTYGLVTYTIDGSGGTILSYATGTVLDMVGCYGTTIKSLKIWANGAETGILMGRAGTSNGAFNNLDNVLVTGYYSKATLATIAAEVIYFSKSSFWNYNTSGVVYYTSPNNVTLGAHSAQTLVASTNTAIEFNQCNFYSIGDSTHDITTIILESWASVTFNQSMAINGDATVGSSLIKLIANSSGMFLGRVSFNGSHLESSTGLGNIIYLDTLSNSPTYYTFMDVYFRNMWISASANSTNLGYINVGKTVFYDWTLDSWDFVNTASINFSLPFIVGDCHIELPFGNLAFQSGGAISGSYIRGATYTGLETLSDRNSSQIFDGHGWRAATLESPWTGTMKYFLDGDGIVHLRGIVTGGSTSDTIAILPIPCAPVTAYGTHYYATVSNGAAAIVSVENSTGSGVIKLVTGSGTNVRLESIMFPTN